MEPIDCVSLLMHAQLSHLSYLGQLFMNGQLS